MRNVRVQDLVLQSVASLVNLTARRIAKEDERDLDQARIGIDAITALVGLLEAEPQAQVRNALSELQMLYAQAAGGGQMDEEQTAGEQPPTSKPEPQGRSGGRGSGLWTPPGS